MDESLGDVPTMGEGDGPEELRAGDRLGEYRVVRALGRGGMGQVYEVEHLTLQRRYALKLLPTEFSERPGFLERFRREARVMANLEHPNIVRVDDFAELEGHYVLRMELVRGVPLEPEATKPDEAEPPTDLDAASTDSDAQPEAAPSRAVSLSQLAAHTGRKVEQDLLANLLDQVLDALAYAHGFGAIHRDLKPGNILLDEAEGEALRARVSDFGLVRLVGEDWLRSRAQQSVSSGSSLTDVGTRMADGDASAGDSTRSLLGTYEYMSPEQKQGSDVDARSDLYAVGLMTCRLLTGRADTGLQLPSELVPGLRKGWDDFVRKALHPDPPGRFQTATEMREALQAVFAEAEPEPEPESGPAEATPAPEPEPKTPALKEKPVAEPKPKRSKAGVWVAVVGVLVLAGIIGLAVLFSDQGMGTGGGGGSASTETPTPGDAEEADEAMVARARQLATEGEPKRALGVLDEFLQRRPRSRFADRAKALRKRIEDNLKAKTSAASVSDAVNRARAQEMTGRLDDAMMTLVAALAHAPKDRKLNDEITRLQKALDSREKSRNDQATYDRKMVEAEAAERRGDWSAAVRAVQEAQALKSTSAARDKLAWLRHQSLVADARKTSDLDKKARLLRMALGHKDIPSTRGLLDQAEAEKKRLAAAKPAGGKGGKPWWKPVDKGLRPEPDKKLPPPRPSASITTCGASVVSAKGPPDVLVRAVVKAEHLKGQKVSLQARFLFSGGNALRDYDRLYRSPKGEVMAEGTDTPKYDSTTFRDWTLRIPVSQLHITGTARVYARLSVVRGGLTLATRNTPVFTVVASTRKPPPPQTRSATVNKVWVTHNARLGKDLGLNVHVSMVVKGCQGIPVTVSAWFWTSQGAALRDFDGRSRSATGQVSSSATVTPRYASSNFSDVSLFIPYEQLHLAFGQHALGVNVGVFRGGKQIGFRRTRTPFNVTRRPPSGPIRKRLFKR